MIREKMLLKDEDGHMGRLERGWPEEKMFNREKIESTRRGWVQG
jgi:hypothetical protein